MAVVVVGCRLLVVGCRLSVVVGCWLEKGHNMKEIFKLRKVSGNNEERRKTIYKKEFSYTHLGTQMLGVIVC